MYMQQLPETAKKTGPAATSERSLATVRPSSSGGQALPEPVRTFFEPRFGHDFGQVRVYTGPQANASARLLNALAYTVKQDIVFADQQYAPHTDAGRRLLAHELTHVVQQSAGDVSQGRVQRQPAPTPDAPPPASPTPAPPAPYRLELTNPLTSTGAHASYYELVPGLMSFGLEQLSRKYPDLDQSWLYRTGELLLSGAPLVPWMVASHEYGHYGVGRRFGWNPEVTLTGYASGVTSAGVPAGTRATSEQNLAFAAGGVNQEQINAAQIYDRWALSGEIRYQEALAYLLAQTNLAAYAVRTMSLSNPPAKDDIASYVANSHSLSTGQLLLVAAMTDLLSGPAWAALLGQGRFVLSGQRRVQMPTFGIGGQTLTFPHWQMLLTSQGPLLGGRMILNPRGSLPVEFTFHTSLSDPAVAVGAQLRGLSVLTPRLQFSPFVRATVADPLGIYAGVNVSYDLAPWVGISGTLAFRHNDLLAEPEGKGNGVEAGGALNLRF
jgi:hypothetical protein